MGQDSKRSALASRLAQMEASGRLRSAVVARELALLEDEGTPSERSGADLFLTGAGLPPTAPIGQHAQAMASGARIAPGIALLDRYEVLALLGVGGMGQVYLVFDGRRGREIAIKVLYHDQAHTQDSASWPPHPLVERLRRELTINERLTHPKILRTYDLETDIDDKLLFFTMEYIAGESLAALLNESAGLPHERCLALLSQIAAALDFAHAQGVIHRDIKPSNVLVSPVDEIKLLDFGIALCDEQPQLPAAGTAYYMAPEQLRGESVSRAVDIYALGVVAFQLLTGHLPQPGMPGPSAFLDGGVVGDAIDEVVLKAMHWRPAQRFSTAGAFVEALGVALQPPSSASAISSLLTSAPVSQTPNTAQAKHVGAEDSSAMLSVPLPDNVVALALGASHSTRCTPKAVERLHQRIRRKRPDWLGGSLAAPHCIEAGATVDMSQSLWAMPSLPGVGDGVQERWLLSRQGLPLMSFVYVPPGPFEMGLPRGTEGAMPAEMPGRRITLDGFWIARTPITNAAWSIFVHESGYEPPATAKRSYYLRHWPDGTCPNTLRDHPVVWLSYPVAWAFCDFYGLSLPTEAQWEKAVRGPGGGLFPWADESELHCNVDNRRGGVCAVGMFPDGASPYGVLDGLGNVLEWCADRWSPKLLSQWEGEGDPIQIPGSAAERASLRGGHYYTEPRQLRVTYRQGSPLMQSTGHTGFRPVLDWRK